MKILFTLLLLCLTTSLVFSQTKDSMKLTIAQKAFEAWGAGEKTGNYESYKKLLSPDFNVYSHPLNGSYKGKEALQKMQELISSREKNSNQLYFSNIKVMNNGSDYAFSFDSEGKVAGGYPYKGFNVIILSIQNNKITGFSEYFGFVDPAWFK